jgi:hypothetical protein
MEYKRGILIFILIDVDMAVVKLYHNLRDICESIHRFQIYNYNL